MNEATADFRKVVEHWADVRGWTKKELFDHVLRNHGRSWYWVDARDRGLIIPTEEDIDWIRQRVLEDPKVGTFKDIDQYLCYDCEDIQMGKPYYTMIPAGKDDPGAFLCPKCFDGLEKKGFTPDNMK